MRVARDLAHAAVVVLGATVLLGPGAEQLARPCRGAAGPRGGELVAQRARVALELGDATIQAVAFAADLLGAPELALQPGGLRVPR